MSFMVTLRNIKKNHEIIECDFYPENCKEAGHIVVNTNTRKVISKVLPKGYEGSISYASHAFFKLLDLVGEEKFRDKYVVMWY